MAERLEEAGTDAKISIEVQPNGRARTCAGSHGIEVMKCASA
ncbi:hypothetical protein ACWGMA_36165 [Streptomyces asiaticus]